MNYKALLYFNNNKIILKYRNIYTYELSRKVLNCGIIQNYNVLEKLLSKIIKSHILSTKIFLISLKVIYNENISSNDLEKIKLIFNKYFFKDVQYIKDITLLKITKNIVYLFCEKNYIIIYYLNKYNETKTLKIDFNLYSLLELKFILLNRIKHKSIYLIGNNKLIYNIINKLSTKYFIYNDKNLIINSAV